MLLYDILTTTTCWWCCHHNTHAASKNAKSGVRGRKKIGWWSTVNLAIWAGPVECRRRSRPPESAKSSTFAGGPSGRQKTSFWWLFDDSYKLLFYSVYDVQWKHSFRAEACITMIATHHWDVLKIAKSHFGGVRNGQRGPKAPKLRTPSFVL